MTEQSRFETTHGDRAPTSIGERLVVGLGAVALLAGLLIAVGNVVELPPGIGSASPTPRATTDPTARPTRTPRPSPTPRPPQVVTVEEGEPPTVAVEEPDYFYGWVRAREEVPILSLPDLDSSEIGRMAPGDVMQAEVAGELRTDDWMMVWRNGQPGYSPRFVEGREVLDVFAADSQLSSGNVHKVVAGDHGFLAIGVPPWSGGPYPRAIMGASIDGRSWQAVQPDFPWDEVTGAAWGPAGWLLVTMSHREGRPMPLIWQSDDGRAWTYLGALPQVGDAWPGDLVATEFGYLLVMQSGWDTATIGWFSADGVTWQESRLPDALTHDGWVQVGVSPLGFYAWNTVFPPTPDAGPNAGVPGQAYFTASGTTWHEVSDGPHGPVAHVTRSGDRVVAIGTDAETGAARVWEGELQDGALILRRAPSEETVLGDLVVTSIVSSADGPIVIGVQAASGRPAARVRTSAGWERVTLPAELVGAPRVAAAGNAGMVVVGSRPNLLGANPVLWTMHPDGAWIAEADPFIPGLPEPQPADCPAPPSDALEFLTLDPAVGVVCFSGVDLTVRVWSSICDECWGDDVGYVPAWLAQPTDNQLFLSPIDGEEGWWSRTAVLSPSVRADSSYRNVWLDITGHFDDPTARTCRWDAARQGLLYYDSDESLVVACRRQFVVTDVQVVDRPAA